MTGFAPNGYSTAEQFTENAMREGMDARAKEVDLDLSEVTEHEWSLAARPDDRFDTETVAKVRLCKREAFNAILNGLFEGHVEAAYVGNSGIVKVSRNFWGTEPGSRALASSQYAPWGETDAWGRETTPRVPMIMREVEVAETAALEAPVAKGAKPSTGPDAALVYNTIYPNGHAETSDQWVTVLSKVNDALARSNRTQIKSLTTLKTHLDK